MYYYKQIKDNKIIGVEAKNIDSISPDFVEATEAEYNDFIASLPLPELPRLHPIFIPGVSVVNQRLNAIESFLKMMF